MRAALTDGGSAGFEERRSRWCAPSGMITAITDSDRLSTTPLPVHGSFSPLLEPASNVQYKSQFDMQQRAKLAMPYRAVAEALEWNFMHPAAHVWYAGCILGKYKGLVSYTWKWCWRRVWRVWGRRIFLPPIGALASPKGIQRHSRQNIGPRPMVSVQTCRWRHRCISVSPFQCTSVLTFFVQLYYCMLIF